MVPSIRSRRVVPNDGPHLSVAHDLGCFMKVFDLVQTLSISVQTRLKVLVFPNTFVNSVKSNVFCCIHLKMMLLGPQESTPLFKI